MVTLSPSSSRGFTGSTGTGLGPPVTTSLLDCLLSSPCLRSLLDCLLTTAPLRSLLDVLLSSLLLGRLTTLLPLLDIPFFLATASADTGTVLGPAPASLLPRPPPAPAPGSSCISMLKVRSFCLEFFFLSGFLSAASVPFLPAEHCSVRSKGRL